MEKLEPSSEPDATTMSWPRTSRPTGGLNNMLFNLDGTKTYFQVQDEQGLSKLWTQHSPDGVAKLVA